MGRAMELWNSFVKVAGRGNRCVAIIVAAGSGSRMKSETNKQFLELEGVPILAYTLQAFEQSKEIGGIVVAAKEDEITMVGDLAARYGISKLKKIVVGGSTRQQSVSNALAAAEDCTYVAVHDGARPFIKPEIIDRAVQEAYRFGSVAVGVRLQDTIKRCDDKGYISETVDREHLWAVQTPQIFRREVLIGAHEYAKQHNIEATDDCMVLEAMGGAVRMIEGDKNNLKITTPEDLIFGRAVLEAATQQTGEEKNG